MAGWPTGERLYAQVREICGPRIILGFSRGKDAIAAALPLMRYFDEVIPVYYDPLPGLEFVAENIDYFERKLFGRKIHVVPHPNFFRMLKNFVFQDYEGFYIIDQIPFQRWTHEDVRRHVIKLEGLPENTYSATGVRTADSVTRLTALKRNGPITASKHTFHAIWDWKKAQLLDEITRSGVKLPVDYALWGRTLDGIDARFMIPLKRHMPGDYRRACGWFPFIEADIIRYERIRRDQGQEIV
jgi:hypothetical protein